MKVKICGIKNKEDAMESINYGADAIGVLVGKTHFSNDFISKEQAKEIVSSLPVFVSSVLVTHLTISKEIIDLATFIGVNTIQLHSSIAINEIKEIKKILPHIKVIKSINVIDKNSINEAINVEKYVDAILLDTYNKSTDQIGGTGLVHDWSISKTIIKKCNIPVILAGGLNINNVDEAKKLCPYALDINSGVKNSLGYKDYNKLKKFINKCKK